MYIIIYKEYGVGNKAIPKEKKFSKKDLTKVRKYDIIKLER